MLPRLASRLSTAASLLALALASACSRGHHVEAHPVLFTSDEEGGAVVAMDPAQATVLARIPVGKRPRGMKLSPDGARLYVALSGSPRLAHKEDPSELPPRDPSADGVAVVDVAKRALVTTLAAGMDPVALDLSPDGKTLYVSNGEAATLSIIDPASGRTLRVVHVGREPGGVTVRPDGKVVFVTSAKDNEVTVIDTSNLSVVAHVPTGPGARSVVVTRDGLSGFVADETGKRLTVIDAAKFAAQADLAITLNSPMYGGPRPTGAALSPDGKQLYVTTGRGGSLAIVDVATRTQVRSIDGTGDRTGGVVTSADGAFVYTANGTSHDVSIVNLATGNVDQRITTGGLPCDLVITR
jgi:YVTN family beta-propeller protein